MTGGWNIRFIQQLHDYIQRYTVSDPPENLPDSRSGVLVDQQAVAVVRVLPVAVGRPRP